MSEEIQPKEKPEWAEGKQVREMTPELREMVKNGWLPLDLSDTFRFTPPELRGNPGAPVIIVRKPNVMDDIENPSGDAITDAYRETSRYWKEHAEREEAAKARSEKGEPDEDLPPIKPIDQGLVVKAMMCAAKQIRGWEIKTASGQDVPFVANPDGTISDESLKTLGRMRSTWEGVMYAIIRMRNLGELEVEGFAS